MNKPILFLIFVILSTSVYAVSSNTPTQIIIGEQRGLDIEYPKINVLKMNNYFEIDTHVYNKSNGVLMNQKTTNCTLHAYNSSGNHIIASYMDYDLQDGEWEYLIGNGNVTPTGLVAYIIQCNATQGGYHFGGAVSGTFEVTRTGSKLSTDQSIIYSTLLSTLIILFIISTLSAFMIDGKNEFKFGKLIKLNTGKYLKYGLFFLSYFLLTLIFFIATKISFYYLTDSSFAYNLLSVIQRILWIGLIPTFFIFIAVILMRWFDDSKLQELAERNLPPR